MNSNAVSATIDEKTKSIWRSVPFVILLSNGLLLSIGNKIYELVLPLMMYEVTHSSVAMGTMRTAELLPNLLFAILIGVIVDRMNKKLWALSMIGIQAVLLMAMSLLAMAHIHFVWVYYGLGFMLMTFNYGYFNTQVSLIKLSVPACQLTSANAKFSFIESMIGIMGPVFTGLLFLLARFSDGILIASFMYLISFFLIRMLNIIEPVHGKSDFSMLDELKEGWTAFRKNSILYKTTMVTILLNSSFVVVSTTVIYFAKDHLHLDNSLLAILFSCAGIGGLASSLVANKFRSMFGLGKVLGISAIINGVSYFMMFLADSGALLAAALLIHGFATALNSVSVYTIRHEQTPTHLIGRITGITGTLFRVGMPFTMFASGFVIAWQGAPVVFISAAILNGVVFLSFLKSSLWGLE
ncbi:MFS transporter [Falsibacillus albus]|uniref:MFS transporter n=1 Tax=Falsibacillus albus TaxID=2478915 RepID=A0A3L7K0I7_9BACI|nr:MFS transporter [Falsibacillus albus]RLQ95451.1 MFS transporter [Falsibacillus albus]